MKTYEDEAPIEVINDRFELRPVSVIARGGMGVVYEAEMIGCEGFSKRVAVKTLRRKWTENRKFVDLLVAEAKLVSSLVHENIEMPRFAVSRRDSVAQLGAGCISDTMVNSMAFLLNDHRLSSHVLCFHKVP